MVDPLTVGAIAGAIGAGGGILGSQQAGRARKDQERSLDALTEEWRRINLPELSPIEFEKYKELFMPQIIGDTELGGIDIAPEYLDAQKAALAQLGEISEGGLTLQDKADLANIQGEVARQDAARQSAIMQNMAERGMGGAGMELAQRLSSQQAGADRAAGDARNVAAQAQARALQAIMDRGQLGGMMRQQEYGMQADRARAQDAINMFNAGQRQQAEQNRQQTSNMNTDLMNQQRMQQNQIAQQQYQNELAKQQGISGVQMARNSNRGDGGAAATGAITSGIAQAIPAFASMYGEKK